MEEWRRVTHFETKQIVERKHVERISRNASTETKHHKAKSHKSYKESRTTGAKDRKLIIRHCMC